MIWNDIGYLLSKNKYNENSLIVEFFTQKHGKSTGILFGASSKKIRNYLLIGNRFAINYSSKNNGKSGYFKIEIDKVNTPAFLENKIKLTSIIYSIDLIRYLTVENQENYNIYTSLDSFFTILQEENWLRKFIFWELKIFKLLGYDIKFKDYVIKDYIEGKTVFLVKTNNNKRILPNFLLDINENPINKEELFDGYKIVGDFFEKTILKPNNINFPNSRNELLYLLK